MPDDPVVDPPVTDPPPPSGGLTESELEKLVSRVVDTRMKSTDDKIAALDLIALRTGLLEDVKGLIESNRSPGVDEAGLLSKLDGLLNDKLKGIPGAKTRRVGPLGRWLTGS